MQGIVQSARDNDLGTLFLEGLLDIECDERLVLGNQDQAPGERTFHATPSVWLTEFLPGHTAFCGGHERHPGVDLSQPHYNEVMTGWKAAHFQEDRLGDV